MNSNTDHPGLLYTYAKVLLKKKEYSRSMVRIQIKKVYCSNEKY